MTWAGSVLVVTEKPDLSRCEDHRHDAQGAHDAGLKALHCPVGRSTHAGRSTGSLRRRRRRRLLASGCAPSRTPHLQRRVP